MRKRQKKKVLNPPIRVNIWKDRTRDGSKVFWIGLSKDHPIAHKRPDMYPICAKVESHGDTLLTFTAEGIFAPKFGMSHMDLIRR